MPEIFAAIAAEEIFVEMSAGKAYVRIGSSAMYTLSEKQTISVGGAHVVKVPVSEEVRAAVCAVLALEGEKEC